MQILTRQNEILDLFFSIIQYISMLSLTPSTDMKRRFAHYFDARNYSSPIQRKSSRETYCFISVYHDVGWCSVPGERRESKVVHLLPGKGQLIDVAAQLKALPTRVVLLCSPLGKQALASAWSTAASGQGLAVAWACHPEIGGRSKNSCHSLGNGTTSPPTKPVLSWGWHGSGGSGGSLGKIWGLNPAQTQGVSTISGS